jgi:hypothetical protein
MRAKNRIKGELKKNGKTMDFELMRRKNSWLSGRDCSCLVFLSVALFFMVGLDFSKFWVGHLLQNSLMAFNLPFDRSSSPTPF